MRWLIAALVTLGFGIVAVPAFAQGQVHAKEDCTCPTVSKNGGWCDGCGLGYVKPARGDHRDHLGKAGDALGKAGDKLGKIPGKAADKASEVAAKLESMDCRDCYEARASVQGGFCAKHTTGFVAGTKTSCSGCVEAAQGKNDGWCKTCSLGYAKGVKSACKECLESVRDDDGGWCDEHNVGYVHALETKCKGCFEAMKDDDGKWCDSCNVGYASGHKTTCKSCFEAMKKDDGGWCDGCGTGYVGATQTWCRSCFDAAKKDARCDVCKVEFKDGAVCRRLAFVVTGLDAKDRADDVENALDDLAGVDDVKVDKNAGRVTFIICESPKANQHDAYVVIRKCGVEVKEARSG